MNYTGLHVLVDDDSSWSLDPVEQCLAALAGGAPVIQLRAKHATDSRILAWARAIRKSTRERGARFVMNDRFDLAWIAEADAVHLGQVDLPPRAIPERFREGLAIGRSTHDADEARRAVKESVGYLAFGPIFGTRSKTTPHDARGLRALREIVSIAGTIPVIAIGGIDLENLPRVLDAGAKGVAVISAVAGAEKPEMAARALADHPAWSGAQGRD